MKYQNLYISIVGTVPCNWNWSYNSLFQYPQKAVSFYYQGESKVGIHVVPEILRKSPWWGVYGCHVGTPMSFPVTPIPKI